MTDKNVNQNNSGNENAGADGNENAEIKFTAEQQKKIDELISQRLKAVNDKHTKELQELNSKHKLDLDEVGKKAKMTAEQLKQHEEDKLKAELESLKKEKQEREHTDAIDKLFKESGINAKISQKLFAGMELSIAKAEMQNFKKAFDDAVLEEVNKRINAHTPKGGSNIEKTGGDNNPFIQTRNRFNFQPKK